MIDTRDRAVTDFKIQLCKSIAEKLEPMELSDNSAAAFVCMQYKGARRANTNKPVDSKNIKAIRTGRTEGLSLDKLVRIADSLGLKVSLKVARKSS